VDSPRFEGVPCVVADRVVGRLCLLTCLIHVIGGVSIRSCTVQTCIVGWGLACVVLGSIILVVDMFVHKKVTSNYFAVLFYVSLIAPMYYVHFRIRVCCARYALHRSILDCFSSCIFDARQIWLSVVYQSVLCTMNWMFCMSVYTVRSESHCALRLR